jgi:hypothetical protein
LERELSVSYLIPKDLIPKDFLIKTSKTIKDIYKYFGWEELGVSYLIPKKIKNIGRKK